MRVVLLGAGGTGTSFAIATRLRANWGGRVRLIVTDIHEEHLVTSSVLADRFYKVPLANCPQFPTIVKQMIDNEGVETYIPILNEELCFAAGLLDDPAFRHVDVWSSRLHALCTDKEYADRWLNQIGVRTPRLIDPTALYGDEGPWFVKPRHGIGSRGTGVLTAPEIKRMPQSELDRLLIQELCQGPEVTVDSFFDAATGQGSAYCRERIETKSGVCTKARLFVDRELVEIAQTIGRALQQRGTICFQAMRSAKGWAVTDLNLRSGAGTAMTCAAGYDVLSAAFACRIGEDYARFVRPMTDDETIFITRQYSEFVMRQS
jgi:carbamoylphosphate synthase large subunit